MFLFERAYRDYAFRLTSFCNWCLKACTRTWRWFWNGKGSNVIEFLLRVGVVISGILGGIFYFLYEQDHGRGFSIGTLFAFLLIAVYVSVLMWGWKAPLQLLARLTLATTAATVILLFTTSLIITATTFFSLYMAILFTITAFSFIVFLPILAVGGTYRFIRGITYECQYDDCPSRIRWHNPLPVHICDCGAEYAGLYPNFYGVLHHVCRHPSHEGGQKKLPTLDKLGRSALRRKCAVCGRELHPIAGWGSTRSIFVVGATSSGKTVLLIQLLRSLRHWIASKPKGTIKIAPDDENWVSMSGQEIDQGRMPDATIGTVMQARAAGIAASPQIGKTSLFLYDAPGEHFERMTQLAAKQGMGKATGIILLADPFSSDFRHKTSAAAAQSAPLATVGGNLVTILRGVRAGAGEGALDIPLAVVISKADQLQLPPGFGPLYSSNGHREDPELLHKRCKQALTKLEGPNAINLLEQNFSRIRYFASSALGGDENAVGKPRGVLEPLFWILGIQDEPPAPIQAQKPPVPATQP